jgi:hypothetical protein
MSGNVASSEEMGEHFKRVMTARAAIVDKEGKARGIRGHVRCPIDGGRLVYSIAGNGHIHAACNNLGCVRWME